MTRDLVQHVFEERHSGIQLDLAAAVEIQPYADLRFQSVALTCALRMIRLMRVG